MTLTRLQVADPRGKTAAAIVLLSLLWAADILRPDLLPGLSPNQPPPLQRQALAFAIFTVASGIAAFRRRSTFQLSLIAKPVVVAIGMFAFPAVLFLVSSNSIDGFGRLALLTLTPLFALVFEPYLAAVGSSRLNQSGGLQDGNRLAAALASVAGAFLVFPISMPSTLLAGAAFAGIIVAAASIAAANCIAVAAFADSQKDGGSSVPGTSLAVAIGVAATLALAVLSAVIEHPVWNWQRWQPELLWSFCIQVPSLLLLFWLMQRTTAVRLATRYVLSPLIAVIAGAVFVRPAFDARMALGLLLMAVGAGWLLFVPESTTEPQGLRLR